MAVCSSEAGSSELSSVNSHSGWRMGASADKRDLSGAPPILSVTHDCPHIDLLLFSTKLHKWGKNSPDLEVYGWTQFQGNIKIYFRVNETNHRPHYSSCSQSLY